MRRRDFISLLGGAAAIPFAAHAQQGDRIRRIGVLHSLAADDPIAQARVAAFRQALQQLGWTDGRSLQIDYRWSAANAADTRKYAAELVPLSPDVILTNSAAVLAPLLEKTNSVPIVFVLVIRSGLASSKVWRGRVATLPASLRSSMALGANFWSFSKNSRRV
jgi:putative ABC transport system substrate-binding protein